MLSKSTLCTSMLMAAAIAPPLHAAEAPPAPETPQAALAFYVGEWSKTGQIRTDARHPFKPLSGRETCSWFEHGASIVCHDVTSLPNGGSSNGLYILTWEDGIKAYTITGSDYVSGGVLSGPGTVEDGVWKWDLRLQIGGKNTHLHYRYDPAGTTARTLEVEVNAAIVQKVTYTRVGE